MNLSHVPLNYLSVFLAGVGVSFTPCVYPLLPVCMSYIGVSGASSKLRGFTLSLMYVTGVAITYAILGVVASLTGTLFGRISSHPLTYAVIGAVIILFGIAMCEVYTIALPVPIPLPKFKSRTHFSVLFLGMVSGLVIGPCVTPVLGSILLYLATTKNVWYGATLLVTFAYGMGVTLVVASTFSSALAGIPKSGRWLTFIKRTGGMVLIGMGIYFLFLAYRRL